MVTHKASLLFACVILLFSSSCKRQKITKTNPIDEKDATQVVLLADTTAAKPVATSEKKTESTSMVEAPKKVEKKLVKVENVDFNYLKLKSKLSYNDGSNDLSGTTTIHIKKDSAIWFSINIMMVEGARGIITKDSIHFFTLNTKTFKRDYYDLSLDSLSERFNFELNYKLLQALLVGNMPIMQNDEDSISVAENSQIIHQAVSPFMLQNFVANDNHKLKRLIAKPDSGSGIMTIDYDNFLPINSLLFPQNDVALIQSQKDGQPSETHISLQHTKVELTDENPGFVFKRK